MSEPASSLTEEYFRGLERALFGIPDFPDLELKVPQEEIKLLCMMLNHVSISLKASPKAFLHCQVANKLAFSLSGELSASKITLDVAVKLIEENCQSFRLLKCDCDAHEVIKQYEIDKSNGVEHSPEKKDLVNLLCVLSTFDSRNDLKDQSGGQCISVLMTYLMKKQGIDLLDCSLKGTFLEVSCAVYNSKTGHIKEFNARPDFILQGNHPVRVVDVGEVESSPFVQMVTAGLGHISSPLMKYLLGMCLKENRSVSLYLMTNKLGMTVVTQGHSDEMYVGEVELRPLSTEDFSLIEEDKLTRLLTKLVSVIDFIRKDYLKRYEEFQWIHDIPEEVTTLRKSTRKRSASSLDN